MALCYQSFHFGDVFNLCIHNYSIISMLSVKSIVIVFTNLQLVFSIMLYLSRTYNIRLACVDYFVFFLILKCHINSNQLEDGSYHLKKTHNYWSQVQGQLHIAEKTTCFFIVWTLKECAIIPIRRADSWHTKLEFLEAFYKDHMLPQLL